jgi:hypothetical protein
MTCMSRIDSAMERINVLWNGIVPKFGPGGITDVCWNSLTRAWLGCGVFMLKDSWIVNSTLAGSDMNFFTIERMVGAQGGCHIPILSWLVDACWWGTNWTDGTFEYFGLQDLWAVEDCWSLVWIGWRTECWGWWRSTLIWWYCCTCHNMPQYEGKCLNFWRNPWVLEQDESVGQPLVVTLKWYTKF